MRKECPPTSIRNVRVLLVLNLPSSVERERGRKQHGTSPSSPCRCNPMEILAWFYGVVVLASRACCEYDYHHIEGPKNEVGSTIFGEEAALFANIVTPPLLMIIMIIKPYHFALLAILYIRMRSTTKGTTHIVSHTWSTITITSRGHF